MLDLYTQIEYCTHNVHTREVLVVKTCRIDIRVSEDMKRRIVAVSDGSISRFILDAIESYLGEEREAPFRKEIAPIQMKQLPPDKVEEAKQRLAEITKKKFEPETRFKEADLIYDE